jgi:hypothetical protein
LGEWIDIDGRDRTAQDTCGGTFVYVDTYAGALAVEFGVTEHLGSYRWYSREQYAVDSPCGDFYACAFTEDLTLHTPLLPHEHEIVHLAGFAAGECPSVLAEGLAEFYSTVGHDAQSNDFESLVTHFEVPSEYLSAADQYGILGRFAAYLVARFGLEAVLDVCRTTGRTTDGPALSAAMESVLGVTTQELLADFESKLGFCTPPRSISHMCSRAGQQRPHPTWVS